MSPQAPARQHHFRCLLDWTGARFGSVTGYRTFVREHQLSFDGKPSLTASAAASFRGDDTLLNPEELLLAALVSCHFMSFAAQCAWAGVELLNYADTAEVSLGPVEGRLQLVSAVLRPRAVVRRPDQIARALALHGPAHDGCFIARSLAFPVRIEPTCTASADNG